MAGLILVDCDLRGSRLPCARFAGARLVRCNLRDADLSGADFKGAMLLGVDLRGACLGDTCSPLAHFEEARLWRCDLRGTELGTVSLEKAGYDLHTRWPAGFDPRAHGARLDEQRPVFRPNDDAPGALLRGPSRGACSTPDTAVAAAPVAAPPSCLRHLLRRVRVALAAGKRHRG